MNKRFWAGAGVVAVAAFVVLVPGSGIAAFMVGAAKKLRDRHRQHAEREEAIRVATREEALRKAPVC